MAVVTVELFGRWHSRPRMLLSRMWIGVAAGQNRERVETWRESWWPDGRSVD